MSIKLTIIKSPPTLSKSPVHSKEARESNNPNNNKELDVGKDLLKQLDAWADAVEKQWRCLTQF